LTLLQVFDQPVMETNCTRRGQSTVSTQALTLLNSDVLVDQAAAFADRALAEDPTDPAGHALRLAFARAATGEERSRLATFVADQTKRHLAAMPGKPDEARRRAIADLCQMLLSANEFSYID
jgi:hypothetical protein